MPCLSAPCLSWVRLWRCCNYRLVRTKAVQVLCWEWKKHLQLLLCVRERVRPSWCRRGKRVTRERGDGVNEQAAAAVRRARFSLAHVKYVQLQLQFAVQPALSAAVCLPLSLQWFGDFTDILCVIMLRLKFSSDEGIIFSLLADIMRDRVFSSCLISTGRFLNDLLSTLFHNLLISVWMLVAIFVAQNRM